MDDSLPRKKRREFLDCWRASKIGILYFSRDVKKCPVFPVLLKLMK